MVQQINIIDAKDHVDEKVKIGAWLTNKRSSGKIAFLQLRDGSAFSKVSLLRAKLAKKFLNSLRKLSKKPACGLRV